MNEMGREQGAATSGDSQGTPAHHLLGLRQQQLLHKPQAISLYENRMRIIQLIYCHNPTRGLSMLQTEQSLVKDQLSSATTSSGLLMHQPQTHKALMGS